MTPEEHEQLRATLRGIVQEMFLDMLAKRLRRMRVDPAGAVPILLDLENQLGGFEAEAGKVTLPELHPAESDMRAGLLQEEIAAMMDRFRTVMRTGQSPD